LSDHQESSTLLSLALLSLLFHRLALLCRTRQLSVLFSLAESPPQLSSPSAMTDNNLQCFFMGTGTSTGLPLAPCLTLSSELPPDVADIETNSKATKANGRYPPGTYNPKGPWPKNVSCGSCRAAVDRDVPEGHKNKRGNTSMVIRKMVDGKWFNIVLDVGKTFRENATRFFPVWGIQTIDAVILTHGRESTYLRSVYIVRRSVLMQDTRRGCLFWYGRLERMVYPPKVHDTSVPKSSDIRQSRCRFPLYGRQDSSQRRR
jgi:hypothetical protein